mmetsp:Transcript_19050/g.40358  ORF Transcript_19050/g.40358 Transcript_19050/m.40358 type:complete len:293 (-) Transcript_19050:692-1570(-)
MCTGWFLHNCAPAAAVLLCHRPLERFRTNPCFQFSRTHVVHARRLVGEVLDGFDKGLGVHLRLGQRALAKEHRAELLDLRRLQRRLVEQVEEFVAHAELTRMMNGFTVHKPRVHLHDLLGLACEVVDHLERSLEGLIEVGPVLDDGIVGGAEPYDDPHRQPLQQPQRLQEARRIVGHAVRRDNDHYLLPIVQECLGRRFDQRDDFGDCRGERRGAQRREREQGLERLSVALAAGRAYRARAAARVERQVLPRVVAVEQVEIGPGQQTPGKQMLCMSTALRGPSQVGAIPESC